MIAVQVVTLILWAVGRFMLYSSYFAIFGALFGFTNFGKMVAIDNTFNGLVGLLQLPFTYWALHGLGGNFTLINCLQVCLSEHSGPCALCSSTVFNGSVKLRPIDLRGAFHC